MRGCSYIFARPDTKALACFPVLNEKHAEAHAHMAIHPHTESVIELIVYIRRHLLRLLVTGVEFARFWCHSKR